MKVKKPKSGFTLIELLVVISIVGLLASTLLIALNSTRAKARDTRRIADLRQMAQALDLFYQDKGYYPPELAGCDSSRGHLPTTFIDAGIRTCQWGGGGEWSPLGLGRIKGQYISGLPLDPVNQDDKFYYYEPVVGDGLTQFGITCNVSLGENGCAYILSTKLESVNSPYSNPGCNQCQPSHNYCIAGGGAKLKGAC